MKVLFTGLFFTLFLFSANAQKRADDVLGFWLTDDGRAKIEIYKAGEKYSGKIVWLETMVDKNGNPPLDTKNPDPQLRSNTIMGIDLVKDFVFERGKWVDGEIYDPDNGKTYDAYMRLKGDKLEVRGYVGVSMFGRTVVWTRTTP